MTLEVRMKVRPTDRTAELDIALDGESVRASYDKPAEVPDDIGKRLVLSPTWEDPDAIDDRTIDQVLADVGSDKGRAADALAAEQAKGDSARKTLVNKLEALLAEEA